MDMKRKMELLNEWKNRRPEMGLIAITCKSTGELFVDISTDTQFAFNSHRFKLSANFHPNKRLQQLWQQYGENGSPPGISRIADHAAVRFHDIAGDRQTKPDQPFTRPGCPSVRERLEQTRLQLRRNPRPE